MSKQGFDWSVLGEKQLSAPGVAAVQGEQRLRWVLVKKPAVLARAAAPGGIVQTVSVPPAVFAPLEVHASEIHNTAMRARSLLEQSAVYLKERAKLAHQVAGLRVLLQTSASARSGDAAEAADLAGKARAVEQKIAAPARTVKLAELMDVEKSAPPPALTAVLRRDLGFVDDIAAALQSARDSLCSKLFDENTPFARHLDDWGTWVIDHKQQNTQPVERMYTKLAAAFVAALDVFNETDVDDKYATVAASALESTPEGAFNDPRKAGPTAAHKLLAFLGRERPSDRWAWVGPTSRVVAHAVIPNVPNIWGNLAGPPSLTIAIIQFKKWREFHSMIQRIKTDDDYAAKMKEFVDDTIKHLDAHGSRMPEGIKKKFRAAMESHDPKQLAAIKRDMLDEFSGTFQASKRLKLGGLLFQLLSLAVAWVDYYDKAKKGEATFLDLTSDIAQTGQAVVGAVDVYISVRNLAIDELSLAFKVTRVLPGIGMALGLVGGLAGMVSGALATIDASNKGDKLGTFAGGASTVGNLLIVIACGAWLAGTPLPGVNIAGLVLVGVGGVAAVVNDEIERGKTQASRVALQLVQMIRGNPFYASFLEGEDPTCSPSTGDGISAALAAIQKSCEEGHRPAPPNNDFVIRALADAGFDRATILRVVDQTTSPIFSGSLPVPT